MLNFDKCALRRAQVNSYDHGGTVSSPNHTFSWASLNKQLTCTSIFLNDSAEGKRMTVEIISWYIYTKVWDQAGIELATPESAIRLAFVARHVTDCATRVGIDEPAQHFLSLETPSDVHLVA